LQKAQQARASLRKGSQSENFCKFSLHDLFSFKVLLIAHFGGKKKKREKMGQEVLNSQNSSMKWELYLTEGGRGMLRG